MLSTRHLARAVAVALLAVALSPLMAQTLHRCGNTFSQTPCGEGTTSGLRVGSGAHPVASATPGSVAGTSVAGPALSPAAQMCAQTALSQLALGPGFTTQVRSAARGPTEAIKYANDTIVARSWNLALSVHNAGGAQVAAHALRCHVSEDEQRVLKVAR
jgi:hypothetical protein